MEQPSEDIKCETQDDLADDIPEDFFEQECPKEQSESKDRSELEKTFVKQEQFINHRTTLDHNKCKLPKMSEIQKSFEVFRTVLPEFFDENLVNFLYSHIISKYVANQGQSNPNFQSLNGSNPILDHMLKSSDSVKTSMVFETIKNQITELSEEQEQSKRKYFQAKATKSIVQRKKLVFYDAEVEQLAALAFCERKYGIQGLRQEIQAQHSAISIHQEDYEQVMKKLALTTIEHLDSFIKKDCQLNIRELRKIYLEKELVHCILSCRTLFSGQICQTIFNIIKGFSNLGKVVVTQQDAIFLRTAIDKHLKKSLPEPANYMLDEAFSQVKKQKTKNDEKSAITFANHLMSQKYVFHKRKQSQVSETRPKQVLYKHKTDTKVAIESLDKIWKQKHEDILIDMYRTQHSMLNIRNKLQQQFPAEALLFDSFALRAKLYKIIRISVNKLTYILTEYHSNNLPPLPKMTDDKMKAIMHNRTGEYARRLLLDVYQMHKYDEETLANAINGIIRSLANQQAQQYRRKSMNRKYHG